MMQGFPYSLTTLAAALLMWPPNTQGQEPDSDDPDRQYTEEQSAAIDRVDQLMVRLQAIPWGPDVVSSIATLGDTACKHDRELGIRVFTVAYSVVAESDFDLEDEWTMDTLASVAAAASRCDPSFHDRALKPGVERSELLAREHLHELLENAETNPDEAAKFAGGVASQVHTLFEYDQHAFVGGLWKLRKQLPTRADGLFRDALSVASTAGTTSDLYRLGNYVFGPDSSGDGAIAQTFLGGDTAYLFSEVRPGFPDELAEFYVGAVTDFLLERGTPIGQDAESFALATQLAWWAEANTPEFSSALESLIASQANSLANPSELAEFRGLLVPDPVEDGDWLSSLEAEIEAAVDERAKSRLRFMLCINRIRLGELSRAEPLLDHMKPKVRRVLRDIIELKRSMEAIANDNLDDAAARVAGLKDSLHQVLGALTLASTYWARSRDSENGSGEDRDAADRALKVATGAVEIVPEYVRSYARIAVAAILAECDQPEVALHQLELGLQELNRDRPQEETEESVLSFRPSLSGGFVAEITHDGDTRELGLDPRGLRGANFEMAIYRLSLSPRIDLDQLDATASKAIDARLRAEGLAAIAQGALSRAFNAKAEQPTSDEPSKSIGSPVGSDDEVDQ